MVIQRSCRRDHKFNDPHGGGVCPAAPVFAPGFLLTYTCVVALGRQAMFQIVESLVGTVTKFLDTHGLTVVLGAVAVVVVGIVLRVLRGVVLGQGSQQG
jgi:hypothetical protein